MARLVLASVLIVACVVAVLKAHWRAEQREHERSMRHVRETEERLRYLAADEELNEDYRLGLRAGADEVYALGCVLARDMELRDDA